MPLFKTKHNFLQNYFFSQLLSSGTILTITLEMPEALVPLQTISWDLSGQPPIMILIVKIIEESNLLQDCVLALVICVNTNSRYFKSYLQLRFWCWIDFSFYSPLSHDEKLYPPEYYKKYWLSIARSDWNCLDKHTFVWKLLCWYTH